MKKNATYFFLSLRRALAPFLRSLLEHSAPLRWLGRTVMGAYLKSEFQWDGHKISLNPTDFGVSLELESTGQYEATTMAYCKKFLKPG